MSGECDSGGSRCVREGHRGAGVGRALVATMRSWAVEHGVGAVWGLADNPGAEQVYERCGFRRGEGDEQGVMYLLDV